MKISCLFILLFLTIPFSLFGEENAIEKETSKTEEKEEKPKKELIEQKEVIDPDTKGSKKGPNPLPIGNFALPASQQISPLVSFGQLVIGADVLQYYLLGNVSLGSETCLSTLTPAILYGITDEVDVFLQLPFSPVNCQNSRCSAGIKDIILQLEYAYYTFNTYCYTNQATIVANITYPTGDPQKYSPTGFGAPSFFLGGTFAHFSQWWYGFLSAGAQFPTECHGTKFGDEYLYQCGYEQVICAITDRMIFAWMIEFNGTYSKRDRIHGRVNRSSGGHVILITPSLWFSTKRWIFQGGLGFPILQNLRGKQYKSWLAPFFEIGYTF